MKNISIFCTGRFLPLTVILICGLAGCLYDPMYSPQPGAAKLILRKDEKIMLFTFLVRKTAVSRSQGLVWLARRSEKDYEVLKIRLEDILKNTLSMQLIPPERILDHDLYLSGKFPFQVKYFLNPGLLPVVTTAVEEELMLRTARALSADLFITAFIDYEVSKIMLFPAEVSARLRINFYRPTGFLYSAEFFSKKKEALPYDRSMALGDLNTAYRAVTDAALAEAIEECFLQLVIKLREDTFIRPGEKNEGSRD